MTIHLEHLARLERQRLSTQMAESRRLLGLLPQVVALLVSRYGARRVILFGSLARGDLSGDLDVDLAVEGVRPDEHWDAAGAAARLLGADVDLVALEDVVGRLSDVIRRDGRVLHE